MSTSWLKHWLFSKPIQELHSCIDVQASSDAPLTVYCERESCMGNQGTKQEARPGTAKPGAVDQQSK
jgi:hypothetical protein